MRLDEARRVVNEAAVGDYGQSVGGAVEMVSVPGIGKVWAEPTDTDDTFPPAIASYEARGGWLVYHGRDGSVGVVVGSRRELQDWMSAVDRLSRSGGGGGAPRPWSASDGGAANIAKATAAARRVFPGVVLRFLTDESGGGGGEHGAEATVINAHLDDTTDVGGSRVHAGSKTAAHEAAHRAFSSNPDAGRTAMAALKRWGRKVSIYHSLAGDFEGLMDSAAWWALDPRAMQRKAPDLFAAVEAWLRR